MITLNKLIYILLNTLNKNTMIINKQQIENGVEKTMRDYKDTLKFLEKYDKGEVSRPKRLDKYSGLRDYIQSI